MKNTCMDTTTISMLLAKARPQGWADLPHGLLQSIISLLSCTLDLIAFISTCPNWRAAFLSAKPTLCKLFPPLIIRSCAQMSMTSKIHLTWQLTDPARPTTRFYRPIPPGILEMEFVGCSYGHAIFASLLDTSHVSIVNVFTDIMVSSPPCPYVLARAFTKSVGPLLTGSLVYSKILYCTLTAPLSSPNSYLLVSTFFGLFAWRIGSDSWLEHIYVAKQLSIKQALVFKGQIIAMDHLSLYIVCFNQSQHGISIEELDVVWGDDNMSVDELNDSRLVVCGDTLILVARLGSWTGSFGSFYLDSSTKPAKWLPAVKIDWAIFTGSEYRSQSWASAYPERWGGKTRHVNVPNDRDIGDKVFPPGTTKLQPSWVLPSVLYLDD
ncbi:hypothetical protein ACP70R_042160 [Stipagrostis hirtigluma subsp. patula]